MRRIGIIVCALALVVAVPVAHCPQWACGGASETMACCALPDGDTITHAPCCSGETCALSQAPDAVLKPLSLLRDSAPTPLSPPTGLVARDAGPYLAAHSLRSYIPPPVTAQRSVVLTL